METIVRPGDLQEHILRGFQSCSEFLSPKIKMQPSDRKKVFETKIDHQMIPFKKGSKKGPRQLGHFARK